MSKQCDTECASSSQRALRVHLMHVARLLSREGEQTTMQMRKGKPGGRPPLSDKSEVFTVLVSSELMERLRAQTRKHGSTLAWYARQAIEEKLEREREDAPKPEEGESKP